MLVFSTQSEAEVFIVPWIDQEWWNLPQLAYLQLLISIFFHKLLFVLFLIIFLNIFFGTKAIFILICMIVAFSFTVSGEVLGFLFKYFCSFSIDTNSYWHRQPQQWTCTNKEMTRASPIYWILKMIERVCHLSKDTNTLIFRKMVEDAIFAAR